MQGVLPYQCCGNLWRKTRSRWSSPFGDAIVHVRVLFDAGLDLLLVRVTLMFAQFLALAVSWNTGCSSGAMLDHSVSCPSSVLEPFGRCCFLR